MLYLYNKDLKNRKIYNKAELKKICLSFLLKHLVNKCIKQNFNTKLIIVLKHILLKRKLMSKTKLVRRCILTNRSRGSTRNFNISRIRFREMLTCGLIPGYKKAIW